MYQTHGWRPPWNFPRHRENFRGRYRRIGGRQSSRLAGSTHEDATFAGTQPALHLSEVHDHDPASRTFSSPPTSGRRLIRRSATGARSARAYGGPAARAVRAESRSYLAATSAYGCSALLPFSCRTDIDASARKRTAALVTDEDRDDAGDCDHGVLAVFGPPSHRRSAERHDVDVWRCSAPTVAAGSSHLLMGSVAERVVRMAPCPVLTVRHPQHEFVVPDALVAVARA